MKWSRGKMTIALLTAVAALRLPPAVSTRRDALGLAAAAAALPISPAFAAPQLVSKELSQLIVKAKKLRGDVAKGAAADRSAANYAKIAERVRRDEATVLQPLRAAMIAAAASAPDSLSEEQRKQLRFQPIALKGHMLELGQALDAYNLDEYVSKSTGETYPGGKVERELEEVGETCDDFLDLLAGKAVEQRKD